MCHSVRLSLPPETATRIRSSGPNIRSDLIARATCSCTNSVMHNLQKAALWRGRPITALVLHFVQFIQRLSKTPFSGVLSLPSPCDVLLRVRLSRRVPCGLAEGRFEQPDSLLECTLV